MKYYLSRADPSVRARAWAGVVLPPIPHVPRRLYVAPLHGVLNGSVAVHADLLLLEALGEVVLGIARLPRVRASRLAEVPSAEAGDAVLRRGAARPPDPKGHQSTALLKKRRGRSVR